VPAIEILITMSYWEEREGERKVRNKRRDGGIWDVSTSTSREKADLGGRTWGGVRPKIVLGGNGQRLRLTVDHAGKFKTADVVTDVNVRKR